MILDGKSVAKLKGVHLDLVRVVHRAVVLMPPDMGFIITCGLRTMKEQKMLVAQGASRTLRSRHLPGAKTGLSHAVDFAVTLHGKVRWDWPLYAKLAKVVKEAARIEKVPIEWGGDWRSFKDGPHFQLPWKQYPG